MRPPTRLAAAAHRLMARLGYVRFDASRYYGEDGQGLVLR